MDQAPGIFFYDTIFPAAIPKRIAGYEYNLNYPFAQFFYPLHPAELGPSAPGALDGGTPPTRPSHLRQHRATVTRFLLRRLGSSLVVLAGVSVITFFLARVVPVDAAAVYIGPARRAEELERVRTQLGLDQPLPTST